MKGGKEKEKGEKGLRNTQGMYKKYVVNDKQILSQIIVFTIGRNVKLCSPQSCLWCFSS